MSADTLESHAALRGALLRHRGVDRLSRRQVEVWRLVAEGLTNKEVAVRLGLKEGTACKHRDLVREKLGVRNAADLTREAVRFGVIRVEVLP